MQLLNAESFIAIGRSSNFRIERRALWQRPESEHFKVLPMQSGSKEFPLRAIGDAIEEFAIEPSGFSFEKRLHHPLSRTIGAGFLGIGGKQMKNGIENQREQQEVNCFHSGIDSSRRNERGRALRIVIPISSRSLPVPEGAMSHGSQNQ